MYFVAALFMFLIVNKKVFNVYKLFAGGLSLFVSYYIHLG